MDEDIKRCSKCGILSLKKNFHKNAKTSDGFYPQCKLCRKNYYNENLVKIKKYNLDNRDKIITQQNEYKNNKYKSDDTFRLICKTRNRVYQAMKGKTKLSSTKEILGNDIDLYRKWIEWQFPTEMNWSNTEVDHIKPICMFDVSKEEELKEASFWKNTQPLLKHDHQNKGIKFKFLDYQLHFMKAYQFSKLNEERFNENIH